MVHCTTKQNINITKSLEDRLDYNKKNKKSPTVNYIGQIVEVFQRPKLLSMKFVKKQSGSENLFKFPTPEDNDIAVPFSYILQHLEQPSMNNREQLTFKNVAKVIR